MGGYISQNILALHTHTCSNLNHNKIHSSEEASQVLLFASVCLVWVSGHFVEKAFLAQEQNTGHRLGR